MDLLLAAQETIPQADRLLSVTGSVRWLKVHGITVHVNTIRHWYRSGWIDVVLKDAVTSRSGRKRYWIPLATLERIAACPCCAGRK